MKLLAIQSIRIGGIAYLLLAASSLARADTLDCFSMTSPEVYYAPPGTLIGPASTYDTYGIYSPGTVIYGDGWFSYTYSFVASATYTNNCSEVVSIGSYFSTESDPMLAVYPPGSPAAGYPIIDFNFDPWVIFALGDSGNYAFEGYLWSPEAPMGYSWTATIGVEACAEFSGCAWKYTEFTAVVRDPPMRLFSSAKTSEASESGTALLMGIGIALISLWRMKCRLSRFLWF
jgi:hypothetical protein